MRRIIFQFVFLFLLAASPVLAQSTIVSATVTDAGGQAWFGGTYQINFYPAPVNPRGPYNWTGGPFNPGFVYSGALNGSGAFTQTLPSSTAIAPSGSKWTITVCPAATSPCFTSGPITITGGSQSVSASITPPVIAISLSNPPGPVRAYVDSELFGQSAGQIYWNFTLASLRYWSGSAWLTVGSGGGTINPGTTNDLTSYASPTTLGDSGIPYTDAARLSQSNSFLAALNSFLGIAGTSLAVTGPAGSGSTVLLGETHDCSTQTQNPPTSGADILCADPTTHQMELSNNGGAFGAIGGGGGGISGGVSGNLIKATAATTGTDAGIVAANVCNFSGGTAGDAVIVGGLPPTCVDAGGPPLILPGTLSATAFGVDNHGRWSSLCTWPNASMSITCSDGKFVNAAYPNGDVGKIEFGTNQCQNGFPQNCTLAVPQGTITAVNSATNVTVSMASTSASSTGTGNTLFAWGTDSATALQTAYAVINANTYTNGVLTTQLQLPGGIMMVGSAPFIRTTQPNQPDLVSGIGANGSYIIVLPNFNYATCGALVSGVGGGCIYNNVFNTVQTPATNGVGSGVKGFSVWGLGNDATGTNFGGKSAIAGGQFIQCDDVNVLGLNTVGGGLASPFAGFNLAEGMNMDRCNSYSGGNVGCIINATFSVPSTISNGSSCTGGHDAGIYCQAGQVTSNNSRYGSGFGNNTNAAGILLSTASTCILRSSHDYFEGATLVSGELHLDNDTIANAADPTQSGGNFYVGNTDFSVFGGGGPHVNGGVYHDECNNNYDGNWNAISGGGVILYCPHIVYQTIQTATNATVAPFTMVTSDQNGVPGSAYSITAYASQTAIGVTCSGSTTVVLNVLYTDRNSGSATTVPIASFTVAGNGTAGPLLNSSLPPPPIVFHDKLNTVVQFGVTITPDGTCGTKPLFEEDPVLTQIG